MDHQTLLGRGTVCQLPLGIVYLINGHEGFFDYKYKQRTNGFGGTKVLLQISKERKTPE